MTNASGIVEDPNAAQILANHSGTRRALFLDRDGVINVDHAYVHTKENTQWIPGIFDLCRAAAVDGFLIVVVTNQAGIARGLYSEDEFVAYTHWMHEQFRRNGVGLLATCFCPHHPTAGVGHYRMQCDCRKPAPGMIIDTAKRYNLDLGGSWLIGNHASDIQAAAAAGVGRSILLGADEDEGIDRAGVLRVDSLQMAAHLLRESEPRRASPDDAGLLPVEEAGLNQEPCPLCGSPAGHYTVVDGVDYHECEECDFIFADNELLQRVDAGEPLRHYDAQYWDSELESARSRSFGSSLARVAEAMLYCRIPVERFIDIGTGPGYLLDALAAYLPSQRNTFYGVEKFPPVREERTSHPNYLCSDLAEVQGSFECGVCIEVLEHLTPAMARSLAEAMYRISVPGSLYLFNTGLTEYVRRDDPGYLDPYVRGHITCWSVDAARRIFGASGFEVHAIPGKTWAFLVERPLDSGQAEAGIGDRIWTALPENKALLSDPSMGNVMYILGLESARAYSG